MKSTRISSRSVRVLILPVAGSFLYSVRVRVGVMGRGELLHEVPRVPLSGLFDALDQAVTWAREQGYGVYVD